MAMAMEFAQNGWVYMYTCIEAYFNEMESPIS